MALKISNYKLLHPTDQSILIDDLNFGADYGDIVGIIGPNGSGKTLFLDSIARLNLNWEGSISLEGKKIDLDIISYFIQDIQNSFFTETVANEINYHLQNIYTSFSLGQIITNLYSLGIDYDNIKDLSPFILSSIECKLLTFVLSLLKPHKIRLVDELDSEMTLESKNKLSQFLSKERNNKITLIVSHDKVFIDSFCSTIIRL
ncbi:MAG: ATP-binding cassette domain-containing protein [Candidatus Delongbacteria bacterium]|nr:ATP-binding cassette domain-containing protein [Candidatus Delongbacteria bacterium]